MRHKGQAHWFGSNCPPLAPEIILCFLPFQTRSALIFLLCYLVCTNFPYLPISQSDSSSIFWASLFFLVILSSVTFHPLQSLLYLFPATSLSPSFSFSFAPPPFHRRPPALSRSPSVPLCQLCDEPGADKRWSASLQMAACAAAAWGVEGWAVGGDEWELSRRKMGSVRMITVLLHFQVKMGTHKRKSIVGSMLWSACWAAARHTQASSLLVGFRSVAGGAVSMVRLCESRGWRTIPLVTEGAFPIWHLFCSLEKRASMGHRLHMWKRLRSKCERRHLFRLSRLVTQLHEFVEPYLEQKNISSHNICLGVSHWCAIVPRYVT